MWDEVGKWIEAITGQGPVQEKHRRDDNLLRWLLWPLTLLVVGFAIVVILRVFGVT